jgi:hypothetical protein
MARASTSASDVFVYTGSNAAEVRKDVTHIRVDPSVKELDAGVFNGRGRLAEVELPQGLEIIGERAFLYCVSLRYLSIPTTVTKIEGGAFARLESLVEMHLPEGLQVITKSLFAFCSSLRTLTIPTSVIEIQPSALSRCSKLVAVDLPDGLQSLGEEALMFCDSLTKVRVPPMIKVIKNRTFGNCKSMLSIELPDDVETIETRAFLNAKNLRNIFFESPIMSPWFHEAAFMGCVKLKEMFPEDENDERLMQELKNRFKGLHVHRLCYFQSYHSATTILAELKKVMPETPSCGRDVFGMTPLHILALSVKPYIELCRVLVQIYHDDLTAKDRWGCDPLGYACTSVTPNAVEVIGILLRSLVDTRLESLGLERWRADVTNDLINFPEDTDCQVRLDHISHLASKLSKLLIMEKLSLLESALWKAKIDESVQGNMSTDRETCRLICGAQVVISNILPFLGPPPKLEDLDFERNL